MTITYRIQFFEYWQSSSGLSAGTQAALRVRKTHTGLPMIPGRGLKGLLNEAGYKIQSLQKQYDYEKELISEDFLKAIFGLGDNEYNDTNIETDAGKSKETTCFFTNAELSQQLSQELSQPERRGQIPLLYQTLSFTKIAANGLADDKTLRTVEATVPLTLYAQIRDFPTTPGYVEQLAYCMQWIRRMGLNRTRGMGRCAFSIIDPKISTND